MWFRSQPFGHDGQDALRWQAHRGETSDRPSPLLRRDLALLQGVLYKVRKLKLLGRGSALEDRPADLDGGIAPTLAVYREHGHLRLAAKTYEASCQACPFGAVMPTQIILDKWNPERQKWRLETHCYGPRDCPRYRPGRARTVPTSKAGLVYTDDDLERWKEDEAFLAAQENSLE